MTLPPNHRMLEERALRVAEALPRAGTTGAVAALAASAEPPLAQDGGSLRTDERARLQASNAVTTLANCERSLDWAILKLEDFHAGPSLSRHQSLARSLERASASLEGVLELPRLPVTVPEVDQKLRDTQRAYATLLAKLSFQDLGFETTRLDALLCLGSQDDLGRESAQRSEEAIGRLFDAGERLAKAGISESTRTSVRSQTSELSVLPVAGDPGFEPQWVDPFVSRTRYATLLVELNLLAEAEEVLTQLAKTDLVPTELGSEHPMMGAAASGLAALRRVNVRSLWEARETRVDFEEAYGLLRESLGADHPLSKLVTDVLERGREAPIPEEAVLDAIRSGRSPVPSD